ncbi:MAG TPA: glycosyltransferase family 2 protein [Solirubrobacteraceae bacterium]
MDPAASIVIPTRDRLGYLEVTLSSIATQAAAAQAEMLVVDDAGPSERARELAERFGARYEPHPAPLGLNAARNSGVARSHGELVVFLDDDIRARAGWLPALLAAAAAHPEEEVFAGRVVAALEGPAPRSCGREQPPITTLDLGEQRTRTRFAWGSNMAIRRSALQRVGTFEVALADGGDEQEWQERRGADALYVAGATVEHRRQGDDARLRSLCRAAAVRGRAARRFDARRGRAPALTRELLTLLGCIGHVIVRRCPAGLTMVAHSAARSRQAWREAREAPAGGGAARSAADSNGAAGSEDFLSGASGTVGGLDSLRRRAADALASACDGVTGRRRRLLRAARTEPPVRRVLALGVVREEFAESAAAIATELRRSRHTVDLHTTAPRQGGKFENLNRLLREHPAADHDWLLLIDDDVELPRGFLDVLLFLAERFQLTLAQPAHVQDSHAAWAVTRRRRGSAVRETSFVEIGPVTLFSRGAFDVLLPFPELRMGWGLDLHWAALARTEGWRCGVLDALAIRHRRAAAASAYGREQAVAEAREFLASHPYVPASEAELTLKTHHSW